VSKLFLLGFFAKTFKSLIIFARRTIFEHFQQYVTWGKPEYPENTSDLSQVTHNLYHIKLYQELLTNQLVTYNLYQIKLKGLVVIANYHGDYVF
jgi:hypothetical protein